MVVGRSVRLPASCKARKLGFAGGPARIAVRRGGSGASLSCAASGLLSGRAELGCSARV